MESAFTLALTIVLSNLNASCHSRPLAVIVYAPCCREVKVFDVSTHAQVLQIFGSLEGDDIVEFNTTGKIRKGVSFGPFPRDPKLNRWRESSKNELHITVVPLELPL